MNHLPKFSCLILLIGFALGCNVERSESSTSIEQEKERIRQADIAWAKTGETKNLDRQMELYSDDPIPVLMPPNGPKIIGKQNIRAFLEPIYKRPDFSVSWHPEVIEISKSGELGYVIGVYESKMNNSNGELVIDKGKYIEIWRMQNDGTWKCAADILNSDLLQAQGLKPVD